MGGPLDTLYRGYLQEYVFSIPEGLVLHSNNYSRRFKRPGIILCNNYSRILQHLATKYSRVCLTSVIVLKCPEYS